MLGSSDFVRQLQSQERARERGAAPRRPTPETLARVLSAVARHTSLSVAALCSGSKRHDVTRARALLSFLALREAGLSAVVVARAVHVTARAVNRVLVRGACIADALPLSLDQIA